LNLVHNNRIADMRLHHGLDLAHSRAGRGRTDRRRARHAPGQKGRNRTPVLICPQGIPVKIAAGDLPRQGGGQPWRTPKLPAAFEPDFRNGKKVALREGLWA
jgi:hypothetical protein